MAKQSAVKTLFDMVEVTASVVNELVSYYRDKVEEPFGYVLAGLENIITVQPNSTRFSAPGYPSSLGMHRFGQSLCPSYCRLAISRW